MKHVLEEAQRLGSDGRAVAAATLVSVDGSVPRRSEARLLVSSDGSTSGSVSFGCVEADVTAHAEAVIESGEPRLVSYGLSDEDAFGLGLTCGGAMEVYIESWTDLPDELGGVPDVDFAGAMATVIAGPGRGRHAIFDRNGTLAFGDLAPTDVSELAADIDATVRGEKGRIVAVGASRVYLEPVVSPPRLLIYGAGHTAQALCAAASAIGFRVIVADHRPGLAESDRYPDAAEVLVGWPADIVPRVAPDDRTYAVCLAHNEEVEDVLLPSLAAAGARYIGVLGSRRNHEARKERLMRAGMTWEQVDGLRGPVGLGIGALTPEEIAVSIVAELVAVRRNHAVD
jgi:xanthine dehydrogenase accessory factor